MQTPESTFVRLLVPIVCAAAAVLISCGGSKPIGPEPVERGWVSRDVLAQPEHHPFQARYDTVKVEDELVRMIPKLDEGVDMLVFFGTWCPDSRREVPRFLKVVDMARVPADRVRLYALDRTKKSDDGLSEKYRIERVPTFIFERGGREIGRITEAPESTIEGDMVSILSGSGSH